MPGQRYRQAGFWTFRYGKCPVCYRVEKYAIRARPGERLRHKRCPCGATLGRNANSRATPDVRAASAVERLARKMGVRDAHVRP